MSAAIAEDNGPMQAQPHVSAKADDLLINMASDPEIDNGRDGSNILSFASRR
jgi:hypothetical protein